MSDLPSPSERARILVVDDVTRNLQVVGTLLRQAGYEIMPTTSGLQALERVRVQPPDLILLDMMMPDIDGLEVCRRLKADPATRQIPVIFLTANNELEHLVNAFDVGAVDFITKPFNAPELLARARTHIELKHARERLRQLNEEKDEFMGIAAHDLRSPLNAIKGYSEVILEDDALDADNADLIRRIHEAAARMALMVQNLLDTNRIERGEIRVAPVDADPSPVLLSVVDALRPRADAKGQLIELAGTGAALRVRMDPALTMQVLDNLVSNAVKYSPRDARIHIRIEGLASTVRIAVRDEGPGISAEDQTRLFGKFARLSARPTGGEQSTGLGLSIVKRLVQAMGGRVWCESEPGKGATFLVELPLAPAA